MFLRISGEHNVIDSFKIWNRNDCMAALIFLFSTVVAVLLFYTDEMKEQPSLLLLLGMKKEKYRVILPQRQRVSKLLLHTPWKREEAGSEIEVLHLGCGDFS